ncbi:MAG TPA: hypothetical protein VF057_00235 [Thermoanaerobaculia bacterium]
MRKAIAVLFFAAAPVLAQDWSIGAGAGPFIFGHFVERTTRVATGEGSATQTVTLSAATRAGVTVDIERSFNDRFAMRLEGTFTRSPLAVKGTDRDDATVAVPAGDIDVVTLALPLIVRINPRGTFRFHIMGGPAAASYSIETRENAAESIPIFRGSRQEYGALLGAGVGWYFTEYFALEGNISDINTSSPFRRDEIGGLGTVEIRRPNHLHTSVGIRYRF